MKWFVYILLCDQKIYYVGLTSNLGKRVKSHQSGYCFATKRFSEVKLVYQDVCSTRKVAEKRERQIKGWSRAKKKALIEGDVKLLVQLSNS